MNKAVLISIRPKWCELIASGKKTIEVRKTAPKLPMPFKCYIYETYGKNDKPWMDECGNMVFKGRGMVIGEFICDAVYAVDAEHAPCLKEAFHGISCDEFLRKSCLSAYYLLDYLTVSEQQISIEYRPGYGWHISDLVIYDKPKELSYFHRPCQESLYCESCAMWNERQGCGNAALQLNRAPESWCYVEELT